MSDEPVPDRGQGGWTFESLLRYLTASIQSAERLVEAQRLMAQADNARIDQRFDDAQGRVDIALTAAKAAVELARAADKEAVDKAQIASDKRFESVNEFRGTLEDQQRTLMPRAEAENRLANLSRQIDELKETNVDRKGQRRGMDNLWAYIAAIIGIGFGLWGAFRR